MKKTELTFDNLRKSTYMAQDEKKDVLDCIVQVLFDQRLKVKIETSGGNTYEGYVTPRGRTGVFISSESRSAESSVRKSILVLIEHIAAIHFLDEDYMVNLENELNTRP